MTLPVEQTRYVYLGPFSVGDVVPIPFSYIEEEDVHLVKDGSLLTFNVDYTVLGQNVTLNTGVSSDGTLVVYRETPLDNDAEFPQEAKFPSEKIEESIDKLTMQNQEQEDTLARAVKFPMDTDSSITGTVTFPKPESGKGVKWDENGSLVNTDENIDDMVALATEQAEIATEQADIAKSSATTAVNAAGQSDWALNEGITWAVGTLAQRPEGSAKYWAERAENASGGGGTEYHEGDFIKISETNIISADIKALTEAQWEVLTTAQKEAIGIAMIYEEE